MLQSEAKDFEHAKDQATVVLGKMAANKRKLVVAAEVPFFDICMVMQKTSDTQGKEKKKDIFRKFLSHWKHAHVKMHGETVTNVSSESKFVKCIIIYIG